MHLKTIPHPDGISIGSLRKELTQSARLGYEQMQSFVVKGVENISAPILGFDGFAAAALTIPYIGRFHGGGSN